MAATDRIIMFWKYPARGRVKTRLIPALGAAEAAAVQLAMARHVLGWATAAASRIGAELEVRFTGGDRAAVEQLIGGEPRLVEQGEGDLGARLRRAFEEAFADGTRRVLVIGADCPDADADVIERAFAALDEGEAVVGPAADGGYYLLGLRRVIEGLFEGIRWSTEEVLGATVSRLEAAGARHRLLPELRDVDRPEDLPVWEAARRRPPPE